MTCSIKKSQEVKRKMFSCTMQNDKGDQYIIAYTVPKKYYYGQVGRTVRLPGHCFTPLTGSGSSRLVALYLYAPATATLPMEVDARSLGCRGPGILLHYSGGVRPVGRPAGRGV